MEQKLIDAFDSMQMSDGCADKIYQSMQHKNSRPIHKSSFLRVGAAICLALLIVSTLHPGIASAMEATAERTLEWFRATFRKDHGVVVLENDYVYYNDGHLEVEVFDKSSVTDTFDLTLSPYPDWLAEEYGRVYFLGDSEKEDITDIFSMEEPFLYVYEEDGITHYIAIGGSYDSEIGLDSVGYSEWLRRTDQISDGNLFDGWLGGGGSGQYDPNTDDYALWYAKAIVELNIPWNFTEAKQQLESYEATE